jgi:transcription initiation factor TFIID subunit 15
MLTSVTMPAMGDIPAKTKMLSTVFLNPKNGQTIESGQTFNITLQVNNLQAGAFTNADATYYTAPQALNAQGDIIGHVHVTVQDVGNTLNPTQPPDPTQFAFFKGINDAGNGAGQLAATVTGGLPPGNYRVCTLTSAANHQPVIMPVAQRGSQDDCRYFTVNGNNNTENSAASDGSKGAAAAAAAASAVAAGPGAVTGGGGGSGAAAATSAAAAAATSAGSSGNNKGGNKNGNGGGAKAVGAGSGGKGSGSAAAATTAADKGGSGGAKAAATASGKGTAASAAAGGKGSGKGEKRDCATERRRRRYVS